MAAKASFNHREQRNYSACNDENEDEPLVQKSSLDVNSSAPMSSSALPQRRPRRSRLETVFLLTCSVVVCVFIFQSLPSNSEIEISEHYYGVSMWNHLPGMTLNLRWAQQEADAAHDGLTMDPRPGGTRRQLHSTQETPDLEVGCESTVLILRHCEKGAISEHCAYNGFERSVYLSEVFGSRWPIPSIIFAETPGGRHKTSKMNFREIETVGPTAQKYDVTIDDSYTDYDLHHMAKIILVQIGSGHWCGKLVVIAWKHSSIAHLARLLGCGPGHGCPIDYHGKSYDEVWEIKYKYDKFEHSNRGHYFEVHDPRPSWKIFGSVQNELFDPLAFSHSYKDYPRDGAPTGGRWQDRKYDYPERQDKQDNDGWHMTKVAFARPDAEELVVP